MNERPTKRRGPLLWLKGRTWRFWIVALPMLHVLYVVSIGPVCWMTAKPFGSGNSKPSSALILYWPLGEIMTIPESRIGQTLHWWTGYRIPRGQNATLPIESSGKAWITVGPATQL